MSGRWLCATNGLHTQGLSLSIPEHKRKRRFSVVIRLPMDFEVEKGNRNSHVRIENNLIENAIRPVALGRKNYLFVGSHEGAKRAAIIYSLVTTAKLNNVEPFAYLKDVLTRISDHPHHKLAELLPQNWVRPAAQ